MSVSQKLLALLIDGDNISAKRIQDILNKVNTKGKVVIKRVYTNKAAITQWEPLVRKYSVTPVLASDNSKGKNSADISLVVEAMALLYERPDLDGFCIVTSDADQTALVRHLMSRNKYVLGIGNATTPESFRKACTEFLPIDKLNVPTPPPKAVQPKPAPAPRSQADAASEAILKLFLSAYKYMSMGGALNSLDGWVQLLNLKAEMMILSPSFHLDTPAFIDHLMVLAKKYPHLIEFREYTDSKITRYEVRSPKDHEVGKFQQAYRSIVQDGKYADKQGWVTLSAIGNVLRRLFPNHDFLTYRGTKYPQLKKVVETLVKDYPDLIESKADPTNAYMRLKS